MKLALWVLSEVALKSRWRARFEAEEKPVITPRYHMIGMMRHYFEEVSQSRVTLSGITVAKTC